LAQSQRDNLDSLRKTAAGIRVAAENQLTAPAELTLASAGVANASASLTAQEAECELGVKSLVALTGLDEPKLRQHLGQEVAAIPVPAALEVRAVPAQLLSQRPDLVAAERTLAAASADIGVAEASRYPRLSLLGSVAVGRTSAGGMTLNTSPWSFGPSLSLPLFDGGRLHAQVSSARAGYDMALASYQGAVRSAVRETEQSLVRLDAAGKRLDDVAASARDYRRYFESAQENWRAGGISLLTLEESRRSALQAEQTLISTRRDRVLYGIALYKALGGGWQNTDTTSPTGVSQ
jgi:NodT family efflux transporter outer membrane factor (OMF) lipoprotein